MPNEILFRWNNVLLAGKLLNKSNYVPDCDKNGNCNSCYCYHCNHAHFDVKQGHKSKWPDENVCCVAQESAG